MVGTVLAYGSKGGLSTDVYGANSSSNKDPRGAIIRVTDIDASWNKPRTSFEEVDSAPNTQTRGTIRVAADEARFTALAAREAYNAVDRDATLITLREPARDVA